MPPPPLPKSLQVRRIKKEKATQYQSSSISSRISNRISSRNSNTATNDISNRSTTSDSSRRPPLAKMTNLQNENISNSNSNNNNSNNNSNNNNNNNSVQKFQKPSPVRSSNHTSQPQAVAVALPPPKPLTPHSLTSHSSHSSHSSKQRKPRPPQFHLRQHQHKSSLLSKSSPLSLLVSTSPAISASPSASTSTSTPSANNTTASTQNAITDTTTKTKIAPHHVPKPSHKPPSSSNDFRGDVQSQDIFASSINTQTHSRVRILYPGMDRFEMETMDVWNHDTICTPCLIVQPKSNRQVSDVLIGYTKAVQTCFKLNKYRKSSTANNGGGSGSRDKLAIPRLTIAGGRNSIHAMKDGCIVLDLSRMRGIQVTIPNHMNTSNKNKNNINSNNKNNNTKPEGEVKLQGGVRVVDLDATLSEYGYMTNTSIFQNAGVVGCILSGGCGFGYASRKYGFACDAVLEMEVILADGRLKRCSRGRHEDLFYAICGGGGGVGVVVSVTMRCFPLLHAALLTFDIPTVVKNEDSVQRRKSLILNWGNWVHGHVPVEVKEYQQQQQHALSSSSLLANNHSEHSAGHSKTSSNKSLPPTILAASTHYIDILSSSLEEHEGVNNDVFSQLILPTKQFSSIQFIATSIDDTIIPQKEGFIERYHELERKSKRGILGSVGSSTGVFSRLKINNSNNTTKSFRQYSSTSNEMKLYGWDRIPGLSDLITNKFGSTTRNNVHFRMVRYADQLQSHSNEYFTSGNIYTATKYASSLSCKIVDILVEATLGDVSPNNESKIYIHILGGDGGGNSNCGSDYAAMDVAFNARHVKYVIFIEGRWDENTSKHKGAKEKLKATNWVNWVVNKLNRVEGIQSTAHPESVRDQVPKRSRPPTGWYNFDEYSSKKLLQIKQKRDPKNVFSLMTRISGLSGSQFSSLQEHRHQYNHNSQTTIRITGISNNHTLKEGEIDASDCLTTKTLHQPDVIETVIETLSTDDVDDLDDVFDDDDNDDEEIQCDVATMNKNSSEEHSISSDLKRLLTMTDDDDEFSNWSFRSMFDDNDDTSPRSADSTYADTSF